MGALESLDTPADVVFYGGLVFAFVYGILRLAKLAGRSDKPWVSSPPGDEELYARWEAMRTDADRVPDARLIRVNNAYQDARRGTKAVVRCLRTGEEFRSWFWWQEVRTGSFALVRGSFGHGPHENDPNVFYVDKVLHLLPPGTDQAVDRHRRYQMSRAG
jgi:hypothetical protein